MTVISKPHLVSASQISGAMRMTIEGADGDEVQVHLTAPELSDLVARPSGVLAAASEPTLGRQTHAVEAEAAISEVAPQTADIFVLFRTPNETYSAYSIPAHVALDLVRSFVEQATTHLTSAFPYTEQGGASP